MSYLTLSDIETRVWDRIKDVDSANRSFDATTLDRFVNMAYAFIKGQNDDRVVERNANAIGTNLVGSELQRLTSATDIRRWEQVWIAPDATSTDRGTVSAPSQMLDRIEPWELAALQAESPTQGTPTSYAVWRAQTVTPASVGKWYFGAWPISSAVVSIAARLVVMPTFLTSSTDIADVTDVEQFGIVNMVSAIGARLLGRSEEMIAEIRADIPGFLRAGMDLIEREVQLVRPGPAKEPA